MKTCTAIGWAVLSGLSGASPVFASDGVHAVVSGSNEMTISNGKEQPSINFSSVWSDASGATHIKHCKMEGLEFKSYAPPSAPQWIGVSPEDIESISYAVLPVGYVGEWHHAPSAQWVITLSGRWSVETTDGNILVQGPGEFQFNADSGSKPRPGDSRVGHLSRTVGDQPNVQLIVKLKASAKKSSLDNSCIG